MNEKLKYLTLYIIGMMLSLGVSAQSVKSISGTVTDDLGEAVISGTVKVKNGSTGTITDVNGKYTLSVPSGATLVFSYIGYITQEFKVSELKSNVLNVVLQSDTKALDEVVVVGYGTMRKSDLTGSISTAKGKDMLKAQSFNALDGLKGKVAGVNIFSNTGQPGGESRVIIRGISTINASASPLYVVDGVVMSNFDLLNPNDIESIEVLKDASSTAIYGSQGANGVIIITTKKGAQGKTKFSYNGYFGVNGWAQYPDMLSGEDYMQVRREAARTGGQWNSTADDQKLFTVEEWQAIQNGEWTDWIDEVLHTGLVQSHQVTASGGTEKTTAMLSAGYYQEKGSFKNDKMDKYNLRMNIEHKLGKTVKVGATTQITHYAQDERAENVLWRAATNAPLGKAYDEDGKVVEYPLGKNGQVSPLVDEASEVAASCAENQFDSQWVSGFYPY